MKKIALITLLLCTSAPAFAQQNQYTGGMKYTTMRRATPSDEQKKTLYNRKPAAAKEQTAQQASNNTTPPKDALPVVEPEPTKEPQETVWDKYRELAAGKKPDGKNDSAPEKPRKPSAPEQQANAEEPQATGLGAIIQGYKNSKEKRGQMKSIRFTKPEINKPSVKKPTVEKPQSENEPNL